MSNQDSQGMANTVKSVKCQMAHATNQSNQSEVAFLMAQLDAESQAAQWALTGLAQGTTQHQFITARMTRMGEIQGVLGEIVGEEEAGKLVVGAMEKSELEQAWSELQSVPSYFERYRK